MKLRHATIWIGALFAVAVAVAAVGCRRQQDLPPPAPAAPASPAASAAPAPAPTPAPGRSTGFQPVARPQVVSSDNRWAIPKVDAGVRPAPPAPAPAPRGLAYSTDADIARFKEDKARVETEGAVNATLGAALPRLKACFDRHGASSGEVTVSVRVHRTGHVMSSSATGVSGPVSACLSGVLDQLKISGVQTESITVQRTFTFNNNR